MLGIDEDEDEVGLEVEEMVEDEVEVVVAPEEETREEELTEPESLSSPVSVGWILIRSGLASSDISG